MAITEPGAVRVVHVDDEPGLAEMVADFLEGLDVRLVVEPLSSPRDALDRLAREPFDAIVSDFDMPHMDGLELLDSVRAVDYEFPFILYTGKGNEEIASKAITRGVTEYMQKGIGTDQYSVLANRIVNSVERYRAERSVEAARDRVQAVFERSFDAMVIADDDGRFLDVNSAACTLFGRSESELLGGTAGDFTVADFGFTTAWETFKGVDAERGLYPVERPDGTVRITEYAATANVRPGEHLSVLRDVTDQQKVEEEARLERERLQEFAGVLAHDLKNPVAVARGRIEMLGNGDVDDERRRHLEAIDDAAVRIEHIIGDVLAISSTDLELVPTQVSLSEASRAVWTRVDRGPGSADIEGGITILADKGHLERLLTNLFRNAVEHGGSGVSVRVGRLEGDDGFYVEDDGPGIAEEERDAVFDWQHSTKAGGTGIGLRSARQVIDASGWDVAITAGAEGGARFEITGVEVA